MTERVCCKHMSDEDPMINPYSQINSNAKTSTDWTYTSLINGMEIFNQIFASISNTFAEFYSVATICRLLKKLWLITVIIEQRETAKLTF